MTTSAAGIYGNFGQANYSAGNTQLYPLSAKVVTQYNYETTIKYYNIYLSTCIGILLHHNQDSVCYNLLTMNIILYDHVILIYNTG